MPKRCSSHSSEQGRSDVDPIVRAEALAELGRVLVLEGDLDTAGPLLEEALTTLEMSEAWPQLATALQTRTVFLIYRRRRQEGIGVLRQALVLAEEHGLTAVALRARFNLAAVWLDRDQLAEAVNEVREGLVLARERGDRAWELQLLGQLIAPLIVLGLWDEGGPVGVDADAGRPRPRRDHGGRVHEHDGGRARGDRRCSSAVSRSRNMRKDATYVDTRACAKLALARDAIERGQPEEALRLAGEVLPEDSTAGEFRSEAYALSVEAALGLSDEEPMAELVSFVNALPAARATPLLRAGRARLMAEQAHRRGDERLARSWEDEAISLTRATGARPLLARRWRSAAAVARIRPRSTRRGESTASWARRGGSRRSTRGPRSRGPCLQPRLEAIHELGARVHSGPAPQVATTGSRCCGALSVGCEKQLSFGSRGVPLARVLPVVDRRDRAAVSDVGHQRAVDDVRHQLAEPLGLPIAQHRVEGLVQAAHDSPGEQVGVAQASRQLALAVGEEHREPPEGRVAARKRLWSRGEHVDHRQTRHPGLGCVQFGDRPQRLREPSAPWTRRRPRRLLRPRRTPGPRSRRTRSGSSAPYW